MPVPNPDYRPNWETLEEHHAAEYERLDKEADAVMEQRNQLWESLGSAAYNTSETVKALHTKHNELQAQCAEHTEQLRRCFDTYRHKTIQDAARAIFERFDPAMSALSKTSLSIIDYEQFTTMEEVNRAWIRANEVAKQEDAENRHSLPVGQPDGLDIFQETKNNTVASQWQIFQAEELHPGWVRRFDSEHVHTLITIDQRDGEYHICFTVDPDPSRSGSMGVQHEIEALATTMYKRALNDFKPEKPNEKTGLSYIMSELGKSTKNFAKSYTIQPEQFHFYIHHVPNPHFPEKFFRMDMDYSFGEFRDAQFHQHKVIPEIIQQAYKKTTMHDANIQTVNPLGLPDHREDDATRYVR
ncbi:MAG: hypothetical protein DHS20C02_10840 [Micavibrio sp.]|nr:MAG: hypothetical protein DHS20C02_10840 [Micavibrio sp.]